MLALVEAKLSRAQKEAGERKRALRLYAWGVGSFVSENPASRSEDGCDRHRLRTPAVK